MASIDWPTTLPIARIGSVKDDYTSAYADDSPKVGAPRRRKVFTRTLKAFSFEMTMTDAEAAILRTFIETTTDGAVEEFNWTHPVTAVSYEVRFNSIPKIDDVTQGVWKTTVSIGEI